MAMMMGATLRRKLVTAVWSHEEQVIFSNLAGFLCSVAIIFSVEVGWAGSCATSRGWLVSEYLVHLLEIL